MEVELRLCARNFVCACGTLVMRCREHLYNHERSCARVEAGVAGPQEAQEPPVCCGVLVVRGFGASVCCVIDGVQPALDGFLWGLRISTNPVLAVCRRLAMWGFECIYSIVRAECAWKQEVGTS